MVQLYEFTQYISPDGEVYRFETDDKFLISETGFGMPPISYITQRSPIQHGETAIDFRLNPRVIQLVHRRNGCSREEYWANRSALLNVIRPNRANYYGRSYPPLLQHGKLRKIFKDGSMRDLDVVIEQGPEFVARDPSRWDEWAFTETLRFIAHDPILYDPVEKSQVWTLALDSELEFEITFPIRFGDQAVNTNTDITYLGSWLSYPRFVIQGPTTGFYIENTTTEEVLRYTRRIVNGETVTVGLDFGNKSIVSSVSGSVIRYLTDDSDLATFHIAPDPEAPSGVNTFNIILPDPVFGTTAITMYWYDRYIGN